jgi:DNA-binding MarR family transcriptional regulator
VTQPRVAYLIGRLDRVLRRQLDEALRPHGLTTPQYTTLSVLRAREGLSNAWLARRSLMAPQWVSEVLAALEARMLEELSAGDADWLRTALASCIRMLGAGLADA